MNQVLPPHRHVREGGLGPFHCLPMAFKIKSTLKSMNGKNLCSLTLSFSVASPLAALPHAAHYYSSSLGLSPRDALPLEGPSSCPCSLSVSLPPTPFCQPLSIHLLDSCSLKLSSLRKSSTSIGRLLPGTPSCVQH